MPPISEAIRGNRVKQRLYEGKESEHSPRTSAQLADLQGALCVPTYNLTNGVVGRTMGFGGRGFKSHRPPY